MSTVKYIGQILDQVNRVTENCGPILLYGENIDTGSRIAGLARGLKINPESQILNVGNCELTHCGVGFGILSDGGQAVLFVKQLDFMLLGLDQICNTFNYIRAFQPKDTWGSFTIFAIVCDQGYQGPQSSLNAAGDFASLANVPVYCLNSTHDVERVIGNSFASAGFRIICVSQRLFGAPVDQSALIWASDDGSLFQYGSGLDVTILSLNFSLRDALVLNDKLCSEGIQSDVFHMNYVPNLDFVKVMESCQRTGKLIVIDDSKTVTKFSDSIVLQISQQREALKLLQYIRRVIPDDTYGVGADVLELNLEMAMAFCRGS